MTGFIVQQVAALHDPITKALVGLYGADGKEYLIGASSGIWQPAPFYNNNPGITGGSVLGVSNFGAAFTSSTGTPGNVTNNSPRGRVALAAASTTIVVANSLVTVNSMVSCQLRSIDGAANAIQTVVTAAGSFTITFNAASTGTAAQVDFLVVN